jgi:membrane-associated PAP2 superfamily phosphatase
MHFSLTARSWKAAGLLLLLCLVSPCARVAAQSTCEGGVVGFPRDSVYELARERYVPKWHTMITSIPNDWARFSRSAFRSCNLSGWVGMTALTGVLIVTDDETWKLSDRWYQGSKSVQEVSDFFEYLGDGRPQFGLAGAFAAYGLVAGDRRSLRTASQVVEAILACGLVVQTLKHTTGRESPFVSSRPGGRWVFLPNQIEYHKHVPQYDAYPSGHIATALATVTVVAENYPEWTWVKPVGYTIVACIGIAMGNTGIHWYSDYPLGLLLGYSFGMLAAHPEGLPGSESSSTDAPQFSVLPLVSPQGAGIQLSLDF